MENAAFPSANNKPACYGISDPCSRFKFRQMVLVYMWSLCKANFLTHLWVITLSPRTWISALGKLCMLKIQSDLSLTGPKSQWKAIPLTPHSWKQNGNSYIRFATVSWQSMIKGFLSNGVEGKKVLSQRKGRLWHFAFIKGKNSHFRKCSVMMWYRDSPSPGNTLAWCAASNWNRGCSHSSLHHVGCGYLQLFRGLTSL